MIETNKEEKCFEIDEIVEENFYSLSNEDKKDIYNKYINKCNTIEDLINLTNELTSLYINEGLITSKVYLKPQNIQNKKLLLSAMEGKIDKIISSDIYVKNSFFFLEDKVLNLRDLEVGIENLNRLQSNNASLDIKPSAKQGYSVVEIENKATSPLYGYLTYNNFGTEITGKHQIGASVGLDNMLHINDSLLINYNTTNKHKQSSNSKSTYINYSFPIGRLLYTLSYSNSTYNQEIPVGNNTFIASGDSNNYTLDLNYKAFHNQNHKLNLGTFVNYYTTNFNSEVVNNNIEFDSLNKELGDNFGIKGAIIGSTVEFVMQITPELGKQYYKNDGNILEMDYLAVYKNIDFIDIGTMATVGAITPKVYESGTSLKIIQEAFNKGKYYSKLNSKNLIKQNKFDTKAKDSFKTVGEHIGIQTSIIGAKQVIKLIDDEDIQEPQGK